MRLCALVDRDVHGNVQGDGEIQKAVGGEERKGIGEERRYIRPDTRASARAESAGGIRIPSPLMSVVSRVQEAGRHRGHGRKSDRKGGASPIGNPGSPVSSKCAPPTRTPRPPFPSSPHLLPAALVLCSSQLSPSRALEPPKISLFAALYNTLAALFSMSVSPQPAPQPPPLSRSPQLLAASAPSAPSLSHATAAQNDSPAQLASLLSSSLQETENLKHELRDSRRRAEKAERLVASYQKQSPAAAEPPAPESAEDPSYIAELEARASRLLTEKEELEARLTRLQESWVDCEQYIIDAETAAANARASFSNLMATRGGVLVSKNGPPPYAVAFPHSKQALSVRTSVHASRSGHPLSAQQTSSLPPSSSRVRPRAGSLDGSAYALTGPGGPPPSKRARSDRDHDVSRYSVRVSGFWQDGGVFTISTAKWASRALAFHAAFASG